MRRSVLHRVCLAAIAVLPGSCATGPGPAAEHVAAPASSRVAPAASQVAAPAGDARGMVALVRLGDILDVPLLDRLVDPLVRWHHDLRDRLHGVADGLTGLASQVGIMIPDLTVLSVEPIAHTESSGFGWRDDPIRHTRSFHSGTDFRADHGTPVVAAGDGVVVFCGRMGGYGNLISIDHGGGVITRYAHLRRILTAKGAAVTAGAAIGQVGSTGRTTGPHLHFEVRLDGSPVSPIAAMAIAAMQREVPLAGRLAALSLSPELQATAESEVDPPKQHARPVQRPERPGRAKRQQVLW